MGTATAMSYVEKNLISGEKLVYRTGIHWIVLFWPFVIALLLAAAGVGAYVYRRDFIWAGAGLCIVAAIVAMVAWVRRDATEMAVTNRRVIVKTGVASRRSLEIMLPKVESIGIDETAGGRLLGYGTLTIHGTGGTPEPFRMIAHPTEFRRQVQQQVDAATVRP
jgi:uncharacterized membrane protein YdbT with pleckstrin-like domain